MLVCVVAFFGVVALVNAIMIRFAVSTFGGVETESSYKAGLAFAREIASSEAQNQRGWKVTTSLGAIVNGRMRIELTAFDTTGQPLVGHEARIRLSHPTDRRRDRTFDVLPTAAGRFAGQAEIEPGQWELVVDLLRDEERMFRSRERVVLKQEAVR